MRHDGLCKNVLKVMGFVNMIDILRCGRFSEKDLDLVELETAINYHILYITVHSISFNETLCMIEGVN